MHLTEHPQVLLVRFHVWDARAQFGSLTRMEKHNLAQSRCATAASHGGKSSKKQNKSCRYTEDIVVSVICHYLHVKAVVLSFMEKPY